MNTRFQIHLKCHSTLFCSSGPHKWQQSGSKPLAAGINLQALIHIVSEPVPLSGPSELEFALGQARVLDRLSSVFLNSSMQLATRNWGFKTQGGENGKDSRQGSQLVNTSPRLLTHYQVITFWKTPLAGKLRTLAADHSKSPLLSVQ